jgi:EAL domain-containing protein (putative c-di-GMP-specific phosphodiesterase class I)
VTTIVAIAGHLGLDVIAEGVESREQLAILRECGCTTYQGYLFCEPVPGDKLLEAKQALRA